MHITAQSTISERLEEGLHSAVPPFSCEPTLCHPIRLAFIYSFCSEEKSTPEDKSHVKHSMVLPRKFTSDFPPIVLGLIADPGHLRARRNNKKRQNDR